MKAAILLLILVSILCKIIMNASTGDETGYFD